MVLFETLTTSRSRLADIPVLRTLLALNAEYRRALAAEEYYTSLKRTSRNAVDAQAAPRADITRRVFDAFYKRDSIEPKRKPR